MLGDLGIIKLWEDCKRQHFNVQKQNNINYLLPMSDQITPKTAIEIFNASLVADAGEERIQEFIKILKERKSFGVGQKGYNNMNRFKSNIYGVLHKYREGNEMIKELDSKIQINNI